MEASPLQKGRRASGVIQVISDAMTEEGSICRERTFIDLEEKKTTLVLKEIRIQRSFQKIWEAQDQGRERSGEMSARINLRRRTREPDRAKVTSSTGSGVCRVKKRSCYW